MRPVKCCGNGIILIILYGWESKQQQLYETYPSNIIKELYEKEEFKYYQSNNSNITKFNRFCKRILPIEKICNLSLNDLIKSTEYLLNSHINNELKEFNSFASKCPLLHLKCQPCSLVCIKSIGSRDKDTFNEEDKLQMISNIAMTIHQYHPNAKVNLKSPDVI